MFSDVQKCWEWYWLRSLKSYGCKRLNLAIWSCCQHCIFPLTSICSPLQQSGEGVCRFDLRSHLKSEDMSPSVSLKTLSQPLRPSDTKVRCLAGPRDTLTEGRQIYALENTYKFSVVSVFVMVSTDFTRTPRSAVWPAPGTRSPRAGRYTPREHIQVLCNNNNNIYNNNNNNNNIFIFKKVTY